jgi:prevent-host-death family protein
MQQHVDVDGVERKHNAAPLSHRADVYLSSRLPDDYFAFMAVITIKDAENRLAELAKLVEKGETVVVTRNGKPVFDLVPHRTTGGLRLDAGEEFLRKRGVIEIFPHVADDFDEPLSEDVLLRPLP